MFSEIKSKKLIRSKFMTGACSNPAMSFVYSIALCINSTIQVIHLTTSIVYPVNNQVSISLYGRNIKHIRLYYMQFKTW